MEPEKPLSPGAPPELPDILSETLLQRICGAVWAVLDEVMTLPETRRLFSPARIDPAEDVAALARVLSSRIAEGEGAARQRLNEIREICTRAGYVDLAPELFDKGLSVETVTKRFANADKIRALCVAAKREHVIVKYLSEGFTVEEIRADLFKYEPARVAREARERSSKG
jgi:hypothetical protein